MGGTFVMMSRSPNIARTCLFKFIFISYNGFMRVNIILRTAFQARTQGEVWEEGTKTPINGQKYTKKVHTVCISKIQGSFITL